MAAIIPYPRRVMYFEFIKLNTYEHDFNAYLYKNNNLLLRRDRISGEEVVEEMLASRKEKRMYFAELMNNSDGQVAPAHIPHQKIILIHNQINSYMNNIYYK